MEKPPPAGKIAFRSSSLPVTDDADMASQISGSHCMRSDRKMRSGRPSTTGAINLAPLHYLALTFGSATLCRCGFVLSGELRVVMCTVSLLGRCPRCSSLHLGLAHLGGILAASVREKPLQVRFNPCFCWALRTIIYWLLASDLRRGRVQFREPKL